MDNVILDAGAVEDCKVHPVTNLRIIPIELSQLFHLRTHMRVRKRMSKQQRSFALALQSTLRHSTPTHHTLDGVAREV